MEKFDDMQKTTNENMDATMRSFEGAAKATQAVVVEIADYAKRSFEQGTKTMEKLLGAKSPEKAFEAQTEYANAVYESYVSHASKLGELYPNLTKEAFKPYQDFISKAAPLR
jgi:hypothetical protein